MITKCSKCKAFLQTVLGGTIGCRLGHAQTKINGTAFVKEFCVPVKTSKELRAILTERRKVK